ncbi:MAG: leucyl/phenylalanyl-tRNA--protein transferase [Fimbriimonadaceae bacterium]|nr:leucyl/phenylalanyl-tRNA--protein transferase [Alphaproteobacteria bacterium]
MSRASVRDIEITPQVLLKAYACGIFPMAESADDPALYWIEPDLRGIIPLDQFHLPRRLARTIRANRFEIRIDHDFDAVIDACAQIAPGRTKTWINEPIRALYGALFRQGHCHTIEIWQDDLLVGGLYGVHIGGAFFGESMFHRVRDASTVALTYLVARLTAGRFILLDCQFITDHLRRFGAREISRDDYNELLEYARHQEGDFYSLAPDASPADILQLVSQTSNTGCSTA